MDFLVNPHMEYHTLSNYHGKRVGGLHFTDEFSGKEYAYIEPGEVEGNIDEIMDDILSIMDHEVAHGAQVDKWRSTYKATYPPTMDDAIDRLNQKRSKEVVKKVKGKMEKVIVELPMFPNHQKVGAYKAAFKNLYGIDEYNKNIKNLNDDEVLGFINSLTSESGDEWVESPGEYDEVLREMAYLLNYKAHRIEMEVEFTALIDEMVRKGQIKNNKGFVTWMEDYLRSAEKNILTYKYHGDTGILHNPYADKLSKRFWNQLRTFELYADIYPQAARKFYGDMWKQLSKLKKVGYSESFKRNRKITLTESQYKKVLLREFGEVVRDPKEWYLRVLEWVDSPKELDFQTDEIEVVVYDKNGSYLGYYDKDQDLGFVVTEYGIGLEDEEEYIDEQEEGGESSGGGSMSKWDDLVSPVRGPDNTLDNSPWSVSPQRGPDNTLDNSPWSVSPVRGPANTLT